ncbi:MAG TPA: hypothetical protein VFM11_00280 [Burkholderiales bacterium]|nr:hypothetical protein [Burkholderiales bacterium]
MPIRSNGDAHAITPTGISRNYRPIGAGGWTRQINIKTVDFGASGLIPTSTVASGYG